MSNFWKIFISIAATFIIAGGGMFYLMQSQIDNIRSDNQAQMDMLNKQISTLKSSSASSTATTSSTSSSPTSSSSTSSSVTSQSVTSTALTTDSNGIKVGTVTIDMADVANVQAGVDAGGQPWRLDPLQLAQGDAIGYGFILADANNFTIISQAASAGTASIAAKHNGKSYEIDVIKPTPGDGKVYVISKIASL